MSDIDDLKVELTYLKAEETRILAKIKQIRSERTFPCGCGEKHMFKDCELLQTHWYEPPQGCTGGDYWVAGEVQIKCPVNGLRNRVLHRLAWKIDSDLRSKKDWNLEDQFEDIYHFVFKHIQNVYREKEGPFHNNFYICDHPEEYELHLGPQ